MQLQHCASNAQLQRHTAPSDWQNAQLTIPNKFNRCQAFTYLLHNVTAFRCAKWHSKYVSRWFYYTCLSRKPIQSIETYTVIKLFWNTAHIALLRNLYMLAKECEFIYHKKVSWNIYRNKRVYVDGDGEWLYVDGGVLDSKLKFIIVSDFVV